MKKHGYYEKKIEDLERELERLKEEKQLTKNQDEGAKKILISPFVLQRLIQEEDRKNRNLLKSSVERHENKYAKEKKRTVTAGNGESK